MIGRMASTHVAAAQATPARRRRDQRLSTVRSATPSSRLASDAGGPMRLGLTVANEPGASRAIS